MILVTGGAGFIGRHTVAALVAEGHAVRVLDDLSQGDGPATRTLGADLHVGCITDADAVARALDGVEAVIHLAAKVSVPESWDDPDGFDRVNVGGFRTVLAAAAAARVRRVVYASSCAVYGSVPGLPKRETDPVAPESPYAATKLADEAWASVWSRGAGLDTVGLRYFNVFGPGQDPRGPYGAAIPRFVEAALAGRPVTLYGDGLQGRDFVSVRDVAQANVRAALHVGEDISGRVFNVGRGEMLTLLEILTVLEGVLGRSVARVHAEARQGDVRWSCAAIGALVDAVGWHPTDALEPALAATVRSFVARP
jgi:nucleoside-diphosphate-sugar epimerase